MANLRRDIDLPNLIIYGIGIILGAGIYALIGEAAGITGNSIWISFLLAAITSSFTGLSYAELAAMYPKSAAEYHYVKNAFNKKSLAFLVGWTEIFADIIATSTVALGFGQYFKGLFGFPIVLTSLGLIAILSFINFWGINESSRANMICSIIEFSGLALIIVLGIFFGGKVNYLEAQQGLKGILSASALIFFAYLGFEELVNIAEETKSPRKNLPKALIFSVVITSVVYILVSISVVSLVNWKDLSTSSSPLAYAASVVLGPDAFLIMSFIALFATANTVLISLIVGSRMIYGMSKDGSLPRMFSKVHKKRRTPWMAVLVTMGFSMLFVLFGDIKIVASITDLGVFATFILVNASLILLRYAKPKAKRPFKTPLNIGKFPVIGLLGLISCSTLLFHLEPITLFYGVGLIFAGVVFYFLLKK